MLLEVDCFRQAQAPCIILFFDRKMAEQSRRLKLRETVSIAPASGLRTRADNPQRDNVKLKRGSIDGGPQSRVVPPVQQSRECVPLSNLKNQAFAQSKHGVPHI